MLEVTIQARFPRVGDPQTTRTFQFENDELQAYLTNASAENYDCRLVSLQALTSPLVLTGEMPKPAAKTAGPGAARDAAERAKYDTAAQDKAIASKRAADAEAKAKAEKK